MTRAASFSPIQCRLLVILQSPPKAQAISNAFVEMHLQKYYAFEWSLLTEDRVKPGLQD